MGAATPVTSIRDLAPPLNPRKMLYQIRLEVGRKTCGGKKKKKKESHIKLSICKKDKRNSFPLDTSQRPPARGRDLNFGSLFLNNQKEGASM